jgi:DNA-binding GntR family transcriptional regulator
LIATITGNQVLAEVLSQLVSRTSLAAMLYQTNFSAQNSSDEHRELLAAIEKRDVGLAGFLMNQHLQNVEASLQLDSALTDIRLALMPESVAY